MFDLAESLDTQFNVCEPIFGNVLNDPFFVGLIWPQPQRVDPKFRPYIYPKPDPSLKVERKDRMAIQKDETFIHPIDYDFRPKEEWEDKKLSLSYIEENHFKVRSSRKLHFEHKLWNALMITKLRPELFPIIGVKWVTSEVIKIDKDIFGRLLGLTRPTAALFNPQGSLASHGFVEVDIDEKDEPGKSVRYVRHKQGTFNSTSGPEELSNCKWNIFKKTKGNKNL